MSISRADVEHVSRLARLELSEEEAELMVLQLGSILEHAARVSALDTKDVLPTSHPVPLANVLRQDASRQSLPAGAATSMAPAVEDGQFRVPRILDEEEP